MSPAAPVLRFLGGTRTVTGSKFLLRAGGASVLVDCGLFQGLKDLRLRNWASPGFDVAELDAVVLTHAHLDHSGYLPRLVKAGFDGPVYCTPGTAALAGIVLPDSGHLQEEEAEYANRRGYSKHHPAEPLYTEEDAYRALQCLEVVPFATEFAITNTSADAITTTFGRAGHILGSATTTLRVPTGNGSDRGTTTICFSGDLGRPNHPLLVAPDPPGEVDWLVIESTYGDRRHADAHAVDQLATAITRTIDRGGNVLIPAFAVDRTEVILVHLARLARAGRLPRVPVYVDSPMALAALAAYRDAIADGHPDIRPELRGDDNLFDVPGLHEVRDMEESRRLNEPRVPSIIISASGMATGGRVVHHLFHQLPRRENSVVLIGFQAEGTRGRMLAEGARELKMLGQYVRVRAEIIDLPAFSVHADRDELVAWAQAAPREPKATYVVHGEPDASASLANRLSNHGDTMAIVPNPGETVRLD